jgi:hypothetical protein
VIWIFRLAAAALLFWWGEPVALLLRLIFLRG